MATATALLLVVSGAQALAKRAHVVSLGGYGSAQEVVLMGRALKGKPSSGAKGRGRLRKLASTMHSFVRNDLEKVAVSIRQPSSNRSFTAHTDDEGFFTARLPGPFHVGPQRFVVVLDRGKYQSQPIVVPVLVVSAKENGWLVISDVDDTLVHTGADRGKLSLVRRVATRNADDMRAISGAADVLRALAARGIPVVYVSGGPVELAARNLEFFRNNGFPEGGTFYRHYEDDGIGNSKKFKLERIRRVLRSFPHRKVLLLGDNGEADPEVFSAMRKSSKQVRAVFVRQQTPDDAKNQRYVGMTLFAQWSEVMDRLQKRGLLP